MHETPLGPSVSGSVVLELGPGIGALILYTPPELDGAEIEISPACREGSEGGEPARRTHSQVRPRHTASDTFYAAVYPGLAAGEYVIWRTADAKAMTITVDEAQVTTARWPGH